MFAANSASPNRKRSNNNNSFPSSVWERQELLETFCPFAEAKAIFKAGTQARQRCTRDASNSLALSQHRKRPERNFFGTMIPS
jgi:hypothetical protein